MILLITIPIVLDALIKIFIYNKKINVLIGLLINKIAGQNQFGRLPFTQLVQPRWGCGIPGHDLGGSLLAPPGPKNKKCKSVHNLPPSQKSPPRTQLAEFGEIAYFSEGNDAQRSLISCFAKKRGNGVACSQ
jgi:hypothetical protein